MTEASLRKWHRRLGLGFVSFIVLQALTGMILNFEDIFEIVAVTTWSNVLHRAGGNFGTVYRTLLGLGLLFMAVSGSLIFYKIRQRTRKK
jgi:uncharacterized iron-regulated membrane protein